MENWFDETGKINDGKLEALKSSIQDTDYWTALLEMYPNKYPEPQKRDTASDRLCDWIAVKFVKLITKSNNRLAELIYHKFMEYFEDDY